MSLPLTPEILAHCYDFLAETMPFSKWGLPSSDEVIFKVARSKSLRGWYKQDDKHRIFISSSCVQRTDALTMTMAHEMCHLIESHSGFCRNDVEHSKAFLKLAYRVCKYHGWDEALF